MESLASSPSGSVIPFIVTGVSADGSVVAGWGPRISGEGIELEAFLGTRDGGMVGLGDLPGGEFWSQATGVSADGSVIVGASYSEHGREAFVWTRETGMVGLGGLNARLHVGGVCT